MNHDDRLITDIETLEETARALDPDEQSRSAYWNETLRYAEDFLKQLPDMPAFSEGSLEKLSALKIGAETKSMEQLLDILQSEVDKVGINTTSGRHMGFIPGGGLWASSMADMLAATTNRYAGIAYSNPGAVKIEHQLIEWLVSIMGYPSQAYGNLTSGGSIASLIAVKAARDHHQINSDNVRKSVVYFTAHTHHCIHKALDTVGLYEGVMRKVPMTKEFQMDTKALEAAIKEDRASGLQPFLVVASAGTTDIGAVDKMDTIAEICEANNIWMHVDAAYGGFFILLDEVKEKFKGIERSHSVVLDPHKTLFLPYGSGAVLVRDRATLLSSNSYKAPYMKDSYDTEEINPADTGIELTRHNRALRMWLPLHLHGLNPFKAALQEKLLLSRLFHQRITDLGFETGPAPDLSVSIFRLPDDPDNTLNDAFIRAIHSDGTVFLSSTMIDGKLWTRCAVVSHRTHLREIEMTLDAITRCREQVAGRS